MYQQGAIIDKVRKGVLDETNGKAIKYLLERYKELYHFSEQVETIYSSELPYIKNRKGFDFYVRNTILVNNNIDVIIMFDNDYSKHNENIKYSLAYAWYNNPNFYGNIYLMPINSIGGYGLTKFTPLKNKYDFIATETPARRLAEIWAKALGWNFKAPLYNGERENEINEYSLHRTWVNEFGTDKHIALNSIENLKRTKQDSDVLHQLVNRAVASDKEVSEFLNYYNYLKRNDLLTNEWLEPSWELCECGNPRHIKQRCIICDRKGSRHDTTEYSYDFLHDFNYM